MSEQKRPVHRVMLGLVSASIWQNTSGEGSFYTVTLQRAYFDAEGKWKHSDSLNSGDLLNAGWCLRKACDWISAQ